MGEVEIELNNKKVNASDDLPIGYTEDNNLKIFIDETIDLKEVVSEIKESLSKEDTNEINLNE